MNRIFLLAGEASGDLHGALLARALRAARPDLEIHGVGGARMEEAGVRLLLRSEELAVVGFLEVAEHAGRVWRALRRTRRFLRQWRPQVFVPIDYPDFNFRLLPVAHGLGIPIAYYISPQVWAWRRGRIRTLRRFVRRMIVIFPFEEELYRREEIPVTWVGHPLIDRVSPAEAPEVERARAGLAPQGPAVALLPGSRRSEVRRMAPLLGRTARRVDADRSAGGSSPVRWLVGRAPGLSEELLQSLGLPPSPKLSGVEALRCADVGLVASGTVTLEAALLGRPVIVVYRMHPVSFALARRLVRVEHIAMANLLAGRRLVTELVQNAATPEALATELGRLLGDCAAREEIRRGLGAVRASLGPPGAPQRAARAVLEVMDQG